MKGEGASFASRNRNGFHVEIPPLGAVDFLDCWLVSRLKRGELGSYLSRGGTPFRGAAS